MVIKLGSKVLIQNCPDMPVFIGKTGTVVARYLPSYRPDYPFDVAIDVTVEMPFGAGAIAKPVIPFQVGWLKLADDDLSDIPDVFKKGMDNV